MSNGVGIVLGILAIGGGALGVFVAALQMSHGSQSFAGGLLLFLFAIVYVFGIWCGVALLQRRPGWLHLNLIFWGMQVLSIATPLVSYSFASGASFTVWGRFVPLGAGFSTWMGSRFDFAVGRDVHVVLGLNLLALAITAYLARRAARRVA
jgi:hypothetical protein